MKEVVIYTDGASLNNPGRGGWAAVLEYKGKRKIISGKKEIATNNQMELTAVLEALKALKEPCKVKLFSDSEYVVKGINEWIWNWEKNNFKKIKNREIWKEIFKKLKEHKVEAVWVKAHSGNKWNEFCDKLAKEEASKL